MALSSALKCLVELSKMWYCSTPGNSGQPVGTMNLTEAFNTNAREQLMAAMLNDRIALFVTETDKVTAAYWQQREYTHSPPPTHRADFISDKWARIVTVELHNGKPADTSVYAFVCLQDGHTKTLGTLKAGDIHKPASFKAPAKHARGSVFDDEFKCLTPFGIVYLK